MTRRPRDGRSVDADPDEPRRTKGASAPDDFELWRHTARTVTPLRRAKARVPEVGPPDEPKPKGRPAAKAPTLPHPRQGTKSPTTPSHAARPKGPPPLSPIEPRTARRIARGLVDIDARIDLHGLRQADAERRLRAFLLDARSRGLRTVLVITGKGGARDSEPQDQMERSARGVLRRSVPLWLEQPELRDCVAGVAPAHVRHGGDGALYIHLRKPRRA